MAPHKTIILAFGLTLLGSGTAGAGTSVKDTLHNLSRTGPGAIRSSTTDDVCGFCHVPHSTQAVAPLWGRAPSAARYQPYASGTLDGAIVQPDGASKLCLSCHDGTVALGDLQNRRLDLGPMPPMAEGFIGTDLSGSHPVSLVVGSVMNSGSRAGEISLNDLSVMLKDPDGVRLDSEMRVQCTSCHDPHADLNFATSGVHFWRKPTFSDTCLVCHSS